MSDTISRAATINALTDDNIELNLDSVYDGERHQTKRALIRIIAQLPSVDAVPVEWIQKFCEDDVSDDQRKTIGWMLDVWQKEQENEI